MKEKKEVIVIGCDISKDKIDTAAISKENNHLLSEKEYSNNIKGYKNIIKQYSSLSNNLHFVMESTGNYHIKFISYLESKSVKFSVINPLTIKRYSQMKMLRLKTDKVDARTIAYYGVEQNPSQYKPLSNAQKEIKSLRTVLSNLTKQRTMNKNLLHSQGLLDQGNKETLKSIRAVIKSLNNQMNHLEEQITKLIKDNYSSTYASIISINGIGNKTASGIIAYLGDLSNFDNYKQIASYVGITPSIKESGRSLKKTSGITKQGNSTLRTLLYLSALSASKYNHACKELYQRLLTKGKKKKTALIAVANKLIKQLFVIVKSNSIFINNYNLNLVS